MLKKRNPEANLLIYDAILDFNRFYSNIYHYFSFLYSKNIKNKLKIR
jgi:hypothetical protein